MWKDDFDDYLAALDEAKGRVLSDTRFCESKRKSFPNIDVERTLQNGIDSFWGLESTWEKYRVRRKGKTVRMHEWLKKTFDYNKVFSRGQRECQKLKML